MQIESPAFAHRQQIPERYTCDGADLSPPLLFRDAPKEVRSFALIVEDPDAPRGTFDHWITWNIPSGTQQLGEGDSVPLEGRNGFGSNNYRGPCPPPGKPHRYVFQLYALDTLLDILRGSTKKELQNAMKGHILAQAELVGTYQH